jgi:hypothetical protein
MKFRQAAALTLAAFCMIGCPRRTSVGWYLMTPPPERVSGHGWGADTFAPFSKWNLRASYGTAEQCSQARNFVMQKGITMTETPDRESKENIIGQQYAEAKCIATDDPRLKGN